MREHTHKIPSVFVFGSNLAGIHGAGAAKYAREHCGAVHGIGEGRMCYAYALPTCSGPGTPLPLIEVHRAINRFLEYTQLYPSIDFFVTRVGCGIAGFTDDQIAPVFVKDSYYRPNVILPPEWDRFREPDE